MYSKYVSFHYLVSILLESNLITFMLEPLLILPRYIKNEVYTYKYLKLYLLVFNTAFKDP